MNNRLQSVRILHAIFVTTWFMFLCVAKFVLQPFGETGNVPSVLPIVFGVAVISEIAFASFLRARSIGGAETILRVNPLDQAATAKWRTGNLLSFCFAETVTLFGSVLKVLGFDWKIVAIFFGAGLLLLLLWTPRKIQALPRDVR